MTMELTNSFRNKEIEILSVTSLILLDAYEPAINLKLRMDDSYRNYE